MKKACVIILVSAFLSIIPSIEVLAGNEVGNPKLSENVAKEMIEAVHQADDAFNENDIEKYLTYFTDDFIHDNVSRSPGNKDEFGKRVASFFESFPGIRNYQKNLLPFENYLVFDECTFDIPLPDKDKTITIFHMDIVEMKGNKLKVKTTFGDGASMKVALGLIEPPLPLPPSTTTTTIPNPQPTGLVPLQAQDEFQSRWNKHDLSSLAEMLHSNAEILVSPLLDPVDRNAYVGWQELFFTAFPDINMTTVRCYGGNDWAVSEIMLEGTNSGSYIGNPSTGKKIELRAGYLTRFDSKGLITNLKLFIDSMVIMKQLGFEPVKSPT
jgi:predicted ester cyclase